MGKVAETKEEKVRGALPGPRFLCHTERCLPRERRNNTSRFAHPQLLLPGCP